MARQLTDEEFTELVSAVAARDEVAAIELNVSCPNVHSGLIVGESLMGIFLAGVIE